MCHFVSPENTPSEIQVPTQQLLWGTGQPHVAEKLISITHTQKVKSKKELVEIRPLSQSQTGK